MRCTSSISVSELARYVVVLQQPIIVVFRYPLSPTNLFHCFIRNGGWLWLDGLSWFFPGLCSVKSSSGSTGHYGFFKPEHRYVVPCTGDISSLITSFRCI